MSTLDVKVMGIKIYMKSSASSGKLQKIQVLFKFGNPPTAQTVNVRNINPALSTVSFYPFRLAASPSPVLLSLKTATIIIAHMIYQISVY